MLAADNVVVALYFALLFYLANAGENDEKISSSSKEETLNLPSL